MGIVCAHIETRCGDIEIGCGCIEIGYVCIEIGCGCIEIGWKIVVEKMMWKIDICITLELI